MNCEITEIYEEGSYNPNNLIAINNDFFLWSDLKKCNIRFQNHLAKVELLTLQLLELKVFKMRKRTFKNKKNGKLKTELLLIKKILLMISKTFKLKQILYQENYEMKILLKKTFEDMTDEMQLKNIETENSHLVMNQEFFKIGVHIFCKELLNFPNQIIFNEHSNKSDRNLALQCWSPNKFLEQQQNKKNDVPKLINFYNTYYTKYNPNITKEQLKIQYRSKKLTDTHVSEKQFLFNKNYEESPTKNLALISKKNETFNFELDNFNDFCLGKNKLQNFNRFNIKDVYSDSRTLKICFGQLQKINDLILNTENSLFPLKIPIWKTIKQDSYNILNTNSPLLLFKSEDNQNININKKNIKNDGSFNKLINKYSEKYSKKINKPRYLILKKNVVYKYCFAIYKNIIANEKNLQLNKVIPKETSVSIGVGENSALFYDQASQVQPYLAKYLQNNISNEKKVKESNISISYMQYAKNDSNNNVNNSKSNSRLPNSFKKSLDNLQEVIQSCKGKKPLKENLKLKSSATSVKTQNNKKKSENNIALQANTHLKDKKKNRENNNCSKMREMNKIYQIILQKKTPQGVSLKYRTSSAKEEQTIIIRNPQNIQRTPLKKKDYKITTRREN